MSGEVTLPGFIHDLYSTNQNLFLASPVYQELRADLERHGLRYCTSSTPYSNVFPDGSNVQVYQHPDLFQNFIYRPFPGWFTYRMPIEGLYMVGAATWPGAGTSAISGYLTAHKLLRPSAWRNRLIGGGGIAGAATVAGIGAARWLQRNTV
jgi:phytoene dehydrogenase-like protein